jgi:two-component system NtrC family sensor kinase
MATAAVLLLDPQKAFPPGLIERLFTAHGHPILIAESSAEAIDLLRKFPAQSAILYLVPTPELVLEAAQAIHAAQADLPILVVAEEAGPPPSQTLTKLGASEVLVGALEEQELEAALEPAFVRLLNPGTPGGDGGPAAPRSADVLARLSQGLSRLLQLDGSLTSLVEEAETSISQLAALPRLSPAPSEGEASPRVTELETLAELGRRVTRHLNVDEALTAIVEAAVELTGADEGSLMLLDEATGELHMRAAKNFDEQFVRTFRARVQDSVAGEALRSGEPVLIDEHSPQKIATSFLVHSLIFVPLKGQSGDIGLLGVDNRQAGRSLTSHHVTLVQALAEFASVALENARLYEQAKEERLRLETILQEIEDGVIITDPEDRLLLVNRSAREAFALDEDAALLHPILEAIPHPELLALYAQRGTSNSQLRRGEITLPDGRVFLAHLSPIEGVGHVIVLRDITHLKELDHIKSEFVATVSHDLRSPLTTILGYVDLIERGGPLTSQQREFLRRVQQSTQSITTLVTDLVHLGRIEAGFDTQQDLVDLSALAGYAVESVRSRCESRAIELIADLPAELPPVAGNPIRLRQMINNLVDNAIKYTRENGRIEVTTRGEQGQLILQVSDTGVGIPLTEQPYIFNKFFRASNVEDGSGSGLGLSIVKSIVEVHNGRIWVDSTPGKGSTFTVVLPAAQSRPREEPSQAGGEPSS